MIYKFAAADMDGTLLNDKNEITPYTIEIIRQAAAQGLIFSICTVVAHSGSGALSETAGHSGTCDHL